MNKMWFYCGFIVVLLCVLAGLSQAAPTTTITADKTRVKPNETVNVQVVVALPASDAEIPNGTVNLQMSRMVSFVSGTWNKGQVVNSATMTYTDAAGTTQTITSNSVSLTLGGDVLAPAVAGLFTIPYGALSPGGSPVDIDLVLKGR